MMPAVSMDYFFGISANQFAIHNPEGQNLLGSVVQAQLTIPLWTWGAARSKVRQAEYKLRQARNDLTYTQRNLLAELDAFYREAALARTQLASLRESVELSTQSLDLTLLRYRAGEVSVLFFFFNDTATPEIYTLSLHDALPICHESRKCGSRGSQAAQPWFRQTVMPQPGLQQPAGRPPCRCSERQAETYRRVERATSAMGGALFRLPEGRSQPHPSL